MGLDVIHANSQQDNNTLGNQLPEGVDAQQVQRIAENCDDQNADDDTADLADTAAEGGTAQNDSCDGVGLVAVTQSGLAGVHTGAVDDTCECSQEAGDGVDDHQNLVYIDAGEAGSVLVAANSVDPAAQLGLAQNQPDDDDEEDGVEDGDGDLTDVAVTQEVEGRVVAADGQTVGIDINQAAADLLSCHGDDEGRDVHFGSDGAVDEANQHADGKTHQDCYGDGQLTCCDGAGAEGTGQSHDGAHRQVDTAGDDNQAHTQSQVTVGEQLTQNVQNVAAGQETVIEQGNDHTQGEEANENTQILFEILLYTFGKSFHIA